VIRSVLAIELYDMMHEFNIKIVIKITLENFLIHVSLILCTNSKSLYDCLVRLEITQEKRLMINVMSLHQFYERREMIEIRWIHDHNNSIDFMIKIKSFLTLKMMINQNRINLDTIERVERHWSLFSFIIFQRDFSVDTLR
jgi:hypothetical protein